jgi:hypothetical protein
MDIRQMRASCQGSNTQHIHSRRALGQMPCDLMHRGQRNGTRDTRQRRIANLLEFLRHGDLSQQHQCPNA